MIRDFPPAAGDPPSRRHRRKAPLGRIRENLGTSDGEHEPFARIGRAHGVIIATEAWTGGPLSFDSPAADVIFDPAPGDRLYLVLASQPLGRLSDGTYLSGDDWRNRVMGWLCNGSGGEMWNVVGGIDGVHSEAYACGQTGIFIPTETRGYFIEPVVSSDEPGLAETYDWDWVQSLLRTVDLPLEKAAFPPPAPTVRP